MKRYLIFAMLLLVGSAHAAITLVNATTSAGSATSPAITTTGSTVLVAICYGNSGITDSKGNTWVTTGTALNALNIYYAYASLVVGASHTITCTGGSNVGFYAFAGTLTTSSVFDKRGTGSAGGGNDVSVTVTPAVSGEVAITVGINSAFDGDNSTPSGASWIQKINDSGAFGSAYLIDTASASFPVTWDFGPDASGPISVITALFEPTGGLAPANTPTFSPVAGGYGNNQSVTITSTSSGAIICYNTTGSPQTNGTTGCTTGTLYSGAVTVSASETLYAVAGGTGFSDSSVGSAAYTMTVANPSSNLATNTYTTPQTATLSDTTTTASILYSTSGTPSCPSTGTTYSTPLSITATTTLKIIGCQTGYTSSSVVTYTYTFPPAVATPSCSPGTATYNSNQSVTCTDSTSGASMCYTTDGSTPAATTPGTCSHGTTYSTAISISVTATNLQVIGTLSGDTNSSIASYTYTLQVVSPVPVYNAGGTTSFTDATSGASMYYNNTGGTPACPSTGTLYSGAISPSGTNSIKIIGCLTGYTSSSVVTVQPDIAVASDNFQSYYNSNWYNYPGCSSVCTDYWLTVSSIPVQNALDIPWTNAAWQSLETGSRIYPIPDIVLGGSAVNLTVSSGSSGVVVTTVTHSIRVAEGYYANQSSIVYLHTSPSYAGGGPAVRCGGTGPCIALLLVQNHTPNAYLYKGSGALESATISTFADGSFAEVQAIGCVYTPLLNGSPITGLPAYTDTGCTQAGQPGVVMSGGASTSGGMVAPVYNWSGYNIGGTASGYTPPSVPSPATYTDSTMNTSAPDMEPPLASPWFHYSFWNGSSWVWSGTYGGVLVSGSTYAVGDTVQPQYEYRNVFTINQWEAFTINVAPWNANLGWWLATLLNQPWIVGYGNGGCTAAGTGSSCADLLSYYLGITISNNYTCNAAKDEYCATPFVHGTKVTPQTSPGNQVNTFAGSSYTLLPGDSCEDRYLNGYVEVWCKQGSSPASWAASHTYAAGAWIVDSSGNVQYTSAGGTSKSGSHPTWGTTGSNSTNAWVGASTTDNTVTWIYYGSIIPTTSKYTRVIRVPDSDLGNPSYVPGSGYTHALGIGFPGLASYGSATAQPLYNNWSAGSAGTSGEPCATAGQCVETSTVSGGGTIF